MTLIKLVGKLLGAALFTAIIVGALATGFQYIHVVPLILEAEAFEQRRLQEEAEAEEWAPADGAERGVYTFLSNVLVSFAFALLLLGLSALDNLHVSLRSGLQRGAVGWCVFMALPCLGLSPELPGMAAAELTARQWWWLYAVAFAAGGFFLVLLATRRVPPPPPPSTAQQASLLNSQLLRYWAIQLLALTVACVFAAIPHMSGAPHPHLAHGSLEVATTCGSSHADCDRAGPPSEMAASFSIWCLGTAFAYWLVLGVVSAFGFNLAMGFEELLPAEIPSSTTATLEVAIDKVAVDKISVHFEEGGL